MRISDWSSDVCSSDLRTTAPPTTSSGSQSPRISISFVASAIRRSSLEAQSPSPSKQKYSRPTHASRSEEHTSELQSLMRISYAVFCLKKKTTLLKKTKSRHAHNTRRSHVTQRN